MPTLRIFTNVPRSKIPSDFLSKTVQVLVASLNKEAEHFVIVVVPDSLVTINGNSTLPGATATLEAIGGLGPEINKVVAKLITEFLQKALGVPPDRFLLMYYDLSAHNVAKSGTTLAALRS